MQVILHPAPFTVLPGGRPPDSSPPIQNPPFVTKIFATATPIAPKKKFATPSAKFFSSLARRRPEAMQVFLRKVLRGVTFPGPLREQLRGQIVGFVFWLPDQHRRVQMVNQTKELASRHRRNASALLPIANGV